MQYVITVGDVTEYATDKPNALTIVDRLARLYPGEVVTAVNQDNDKAFSTTYRPRAGCPLCDDA